MISDDFETRKLSAILNPRKYHIFYVLLTCFRSFSIASPRGHILQIHAPSDTFNMEEHSFGRSFLTGLPANVASDIGHWHGGTVGNATGTPSTTASYETALIELL